MQKQSQLEHLKSQSFEFNHITEKTGEILRCQDLTLDFNLSISINFAVNASEKIHIQGENGIGKSTLLKTIQGLIKSHDGKMYCNVQTAYLDQNLSFLAGEISATEYLKNINENLTEQQIRTSLGNMKIRRDKALIPLKNLSGGERLKVALLALKFQHVELLLLDEPENHLDIESRELLAHAIKHFNGSVLLVSHDDSFVDACEITNSYHLK